MYDTIRAIKTPIAKLIFGSALVVSCVFLSGQQLTIASFVYDPATNTYVNTTQSSSTTTNTSTNNTTNNSNNQDDEVDYDQSAISSVGGTTQNNNQLSGSGSTQQNETNTEVNVTATQETQTTTQSDSDDLENLFTTSTNTSRDGVLEYMHVQVDENAIMLRDLLIENYQGLESQANNLLDEGTTSRLQVLQCLGIVDNSFDYLANIRTTRTDLAKNIEIVITDLHSAISALESKIDANLLTTLDRNLQIGSLQNKIDAYNSEFVNMVDMYYELSIEELSNADALIKEESEEFLPVIELFDKRVALFNQVEESYQEFIRNSALRGDGTGPDLQSLLTLLRSLEYYYRAEYMNKWESEVITHIPLNNISFVELARSQARAAFSAYFATQTDDLLLGLYPLEKMQSLHTRMVTLRSVYKKANGTFDCRAVVENGTIDGTGQRLINDMKTLLQQIESSATLIEQQGGTIPKNAQELEVMLAEGLKATALSEIEALITIEKARIERRAAREGINWLPVGYITEKTRWKTTVRNFLQEAFKNYLETNRVTVFDEKLEGAYSRVNTALGQSPEGSTKVILEAIKEVIEEFM